MARIVSFVVLIALLLVIGVLFFRVVADFIVPIFLALVLVVVFGPMHRRILAFCGGRAAVAAGVTTAAILLIFLVPLLLVLLQATREALAFYRQMPEIDFPALAARAADFANEWGLEVTRSDITQTIQSRLNTYLGPVAASTTQYLGSLLLGLVVMGFSLYYFLADGPAMVAGLARLLPLDPKYQQQLAEQFGRLTRSVVLATVLAAVAQGILAGVGYWFCGLHGVFLLTVLTALMAMVPFVGAMLVWVPVCAWVYFYQEHSTAGILLTLWCLAVVSTIDNVIKPLVLHGQANLHPLLALLSVLGGVQALGAIGIFVGPLAVAFLQTILKMVRTELDAMTAPQANAKPAEGEIL